MPYPLHASPPAHLVAWHAHVRLLHQRQRADAQFAHEFERVRVDSQAAHMMLERQERQRRHAEPLRAAGAARRAAVARRVAAPGTDLGLLRRLTRYVVS